MYVCLSICLYVCMYVRTQVRMYVCTSVCMYMLAPLYVCICQPLPRPCFWVAHMSLNVVFLPGGGYHNVEHLDPQNLLARFIPTCFQSHQRAFHLMFSFFLQGGGSTGVNEASRKAQWNAGLISQTLSSPSRLTIGF